MIIDIYIYFLNLIVCFWYLQVQREVVVIPKSVNKERIAQNFNIFDFQLSADDMKVVDGLNRNWRAVEIATFKDNKDYPFNIEF